MLGIRVDDEIALQLHEDRHAQELFRLADENREHLRRWLHWVDSTTTPEDTSRFIREMLQALAEGREYGFGVLHRGELVGGIGLRVIVHVGEAEIGYWLAAGAQGQGIITRSTAALLRFSFDELGMNRVIIKCAEENQKSRAVPERLGFTIEGTLRERDVIPGRAPQDQIVYALLRSDWDATT